MTWAGGAASEKKRCRFEAGEKTIDKVLQGLLVFKLGRTDECGCAVSEDHGSAVRRPLSQRRDV